MIYTFFQIAWSCFFFFNVPYPYEGPTFDFDLDCVIINKNVLENYPCSQLTMAVHLCEIEPPYMVEDNMGC